MIRLLLRAVAHLRPGARQRSVIGTRPGFLWEPARRRWVPVESATSCRHGAYSEFGPVHTDTGLPA